MKKRKQLIFHFILFILMMRLMRYTAHQVELLSGDYPILDLTLFHNQASIIEALDHLGEIGRHFYLHRFFVVDLFYPITYALFYSLSLSWILEQYTTFPNWTKKISFLPFVGMLFDWLENLSIGLLIYFFPKPISFLYPIVQVATLLKFFFVYFSVFILFILLLLAIYKYLKTHFSTHP